MRILGISAFFHDSAAVLLEDGRVVAAAQEERFTRIKHDAAFPGNAVEYCLEEGGITPEELDYVVFYEKPLLKFERLLETYVGYAPVGFRSFRQALPIWLKKKLYLPREMDIGLGKRYTNPYVFPEHHESHAASAFFPSPFEESAIVTVDGVGEWATTTIGTGRGNRISLDHEIRFPHSLGLLYSAFTYYCGFKVNSGEYKLMGLAPYGEPVYADTILENLIDLKPDGSFRLDMQYFNYCQGLTMTGPRFDSLFGRPPRSPESDLTPFYMDMAASIQAVTEEAMLRLTRHAHRLTGMKNLCLAGGVALNCVANGRILRESPFDEVWIQPAAGDAGGALGAALFAYHQLLDRPREVVVGGSQGGSFLGPEFSESEIVQFLESKGAEFDVAGSDADLCDRVADLIADQHVVGWFQGRMEFGPRALGGRSILGDARSSKMQRTINLKIKFRESFRPFAPVVLREHVHEYFDMRENEDSPYMLLVAPVRMEKRVGDERSGGASGLAKLDVTRSVIPAVTHVDFSARVQTCDAARHHIYYDLARRFYDKTGSPVMINTSFNVRGEPIVCTPAEAYQCFMATNMDVLVLGRAVLLKEEQPNAAEISREEYLSTFGLD
jgi:carbamoyltransferase